MKTKFVANLSNVNLRKSKCKLLIERLIFHLTIDFPMYIDTAQRRKKNRKPLLEQDLKLLKKSSKLKWKVN